MEVTRGTGTNLRKVGRKRKTSWVGKLEDKEVVKKEGRKVNNIEHREVGKLSDRKVDWHLQYLIGMYVGIMEGKKLEGIQQ